MKFAGILAGGSGSRMETATIPKQFLEISGIPVLIRTISTFYKVGEFEKIIVSINSEYKDLYIDLIKKHIPNYDKIVLVNGGNTRFESLINIVKMAQEISGGEESIIVTHDCARVFVSEEIILNNISAIKNFSMVTTSIPVIDTLLISENGINSNCVPDRSKFWQDQGPQTFYVNDFLKYVEKIPEEDFPSYIEAGKVYLSQGCDIGIVTGSRMNFKITNDIDLKYAEFLIKEGLTE